MPLTARIRYAGLLVVALLLVGLALTGCSDDQLPAHVGTESGPAAAPPPTDPSAYAAYVSGETADHAVKRRTIQNDLQVDVLVRVGYQDGQVTPPNLRDVKAEDEDEIRIEVTSDTGGQVKVAGYPGATTQVTAG